MSAQSSDDIAEELSRIAYLQLELLEAGMIIGGQIYLRRENAKAGIRAGIIRPQIAVHASVVERLAEHPSRLSRRGRSSVQFLDYLRILYRDLDDDGAYLSWFVDHQMLIAAAKAADCPAAITDWLATYHDSCVREMHKDDLAEFGVVDKDSLLSQPPKPHGNRVRRPPHGQGQLF